MSSWTPNHYYEWIRPTYTPSNHHGLSYTIDVLRQSWICCLNTSVKVYNWPVMRLPVVSLRRVTLNPIIFEVKRPQKHWWMILVYCCITNTSILNSIESIEQWTGKRFRAIRRIWSVHRYKYPILSYWFHSMSYWLSKIDRTCHYCSKSKFRSSKLERKRSRLHNLKYISLWKLTRQKLVQVYVLG